MTILPSALNRQDLSPLPGIKQNVTRNNAPFCHLNRQENGSTEGRDYAPSFQLPTCHYYWQSDASDLSAFEYLFPYFQPHSNTLVLQPIKSAR